MKRFVPLITALYMCTSGFAMTYSEYARIATQSIKEHIEEIKSGDEYFYEIKERLKSFSPDMTKLSLTAKDFDLYEREFVGKDLDRFSKNKRLVFSKINEEIKKSKKAHSTKILKSWMNFTLTKNEKESMKYLISLKYKAIEKETPTLEAELITLMQGFSAISVKSYLDQGYTFSEAMYARHMALYNQMLEVMKTNFDPMTYFHIESCMNSEEKILIHSYYEDALSLFAQSKIESKTEKEDKVKGLLKTYFKKQDRSKGKSSFVYS